MTIPLSMPKFFSAAVILLLYVSFFQFITLTLLGFSKLFSVDVAAVLLFLSDIFYFSAVLSKIVNYKIDYHL